MLEIRRAVLVLVILLTPAIGWSQTQLTDDSDPLVYLQQTPTSQGNQAPAPLPDKPVAAPSQATDDQNKEQNKKDDSEGKQSKRMFWLVPNFGAVDANKQLPPLSTREKFVLAASDSITDYSSYTWAGILAGQAMLLNSDPELARVYRPPRANTSLSRYWRGRT